SASAATPEVNVNPQGFAGPIEVAVAPRVDGKAPEWSATKTLPPGKSAVSFQDLAEGLYVVGANGPQPLQRLSAKLNLGSDGSTLHFVLPRSKTVVRTTLGGAPLAGSEIIFTHRELRWQTKVKTGKDGRYSGELWEPGGYTA